MNKNMITEVWGKKYYYKFKKVFLFYIHFWKGKVLLTFIITIQKKK